jgi:hypothetical protein
MQGQFCTKTSCQDVLEALSTCVSQCIYHITPYETYFTHGSKYQSYLIFEPRFDPGCHRILIRTANFSTVTSSELSLVQDSHGFGVTIL